MNFQNIINDLFKSDKYPDIFSLVKAVHSVYRDKIVSTKSITSSLVSEEFLNELNSFTDRSDIEFFLGKTLRDIKLVVYDENGREHCCFMTYLGQHKLKVVSTSLPYSGYQAAEYRHLEEIIEVFRNYIVSLSNYFYELERIDSLCCVVEPVQPTFKDEYRKILLEDRIWLHVEVTHDGSASNVHLIGAAEGWHDKLQTGILNWDHDKDVVENIMCTFELDHFPESANNALPQVSEPVVNNCGICLCFELPDTKMGLPQPICTNNKCGTYYHKACLYEWLVASAGGRPPNFGIASGECPNCLKYITCTK